MFLCIHSMRLYIRPTHTYSLIDNAIRKLDVSNVSSLCGFHKYRKMFNSSNKNIAIYKYNKIKIIIFCLPRITKVDVIYLFNN